MTALAVDALEAGYQPDVPVIRGVSLTVAAGEVVVLLGPNGAGKSTLMKAIAGVARIFAGGVSLDGTQAANLPGEALAQAGLAYVPQLQNVFTSLTVEDNLRAGAYRLSARMARARIEEAYDRFPDLRDRRGAYGGSLSGGQRQMLAIGRALILKPRLLLLDEPSAGLSPKIAIEIMASVRHIAAGGVAVLIVEQNVKLGLATADRGLVLAEGRVVLKGLAADLAADPRLRVAFLGGSLAA